MCKRCELRATYKALLRASDARFRLPAGSSRARVTTANARWRAMAEEWDRAKEGVDLSVVGEVMREVEAEARP